MDVQRLRYFLAVAQELHFGRAAERLHVTASPLSKQIRQLERELGGELFVRSYHEVRLTPLGHRLVDPAAAVVSQVDALRDLARAETAPRLRLCDLRLGATPLAPPQALLAVQTELELMCPDVPVDLNLAVTAQLLPMLSAGKLDLALIHLPADESMDTVTVASYRLGVAMRGDDDLAGSATVDVGDLAGRRWVLQGLRPHPTVIRQLREMLAGAGVTDFVEVPSGDFSEISSYIKNFGYLTLLPDVEDAPGWRFFSPPEFHHASITGLDLTFNVGLAWMRRARQRVPELDQVLGQLAERFATEPVKL